MKKGLLHELNQMKRTMKKLGVPNLNENDGDTTQDPTKEEMLKALETQFGGFEGYDRFSAEAAMYWYAHDYHNGQWSNLYSVLSTSDYKPSPRISSVMDEDDEIAMAMYDTLVETFGGTNIDYGDIGGDNDYNPDSGID
jgi:hypothetical protein